LLTAGSEGSPELLAAADISVFWLAAPFTCAQGWASSTPRLQPVAHPCMHTASHVSQPYRALHSM